jgi:hypothetical protein
MLIITRRWLTLQRITSILFEWRSPPEQSGLSGNGITCWERYFFNFVLKIKLPD